MSVKKRRVNWHEAASCAFQIELKEYSDFLEYITEYPLGKNSYRIDLLVIKKLTDKIIPRNTARIFRKFNLLEIKGIGSSTSIDSYYKTIGYAGLLINQTGRLNQYSALDVSLTLLSCHYPRKLMSHLKYERKLTVEKTSAGVYNINKETFSTQIIVTHELSPEENLYLRCLTNKLCDASLAERLAGDYIRHEGQDVYLRYMNQITTANINKKGDSPMVCEGILNLCGTSSEEIIERTKKEEAEYYLPKIKELSSINDSLSSQNDSLISQNNTLSSRNNALSSRNNALSSRNNALSSRNNALSSKNNALSSRNNTLSSRNNILSSQIEYLKSLLTQNNIPFSLEPESND